MGMFFDYFKSGLNWIFVSKEGPVSALVKGASLSLDETRDAVIWLRNQFNPGTTTDNDSIIAFAKSRGIVRLPNEPYDYYLARVINAFMWYRRGGSEQGMAEIMRLCGYDSIRIINYRDIDPNRWAEFIVDVSPAVGDVLTRASALPGMVDIVKPARSKCAGVRVALSPESGGIRLGAVSVFGHVTTVGPPVAAAIIMEVIWSELPNVSIILGFDGDGEAIVDWGDGSTSIAAGAMGMNDHTYSAPGPYSISISGDLDKVLLLGLQDQPYLSFDWNISSLTNIRLISVSNCPNAVLALSLISGVTTLQGIMLTGQYSATGQLSDLPTSIYSIQLTETPVSGQLSDLSGYPFISTGFLESLMGIPGPAISISYGSVTGDVSDLYNLNLKTINLSHLVANYSSGLVPSSFFNGEYRFTYCTGWDRWIVGQVLIDFDAGIPSGASGTLDLRGNGTPLQDQPGVEAAYDSLLSKGYHIYIDG